MVSGEPVRAGQRMLRNQRAGLEGVQLVGEQAEPERHITLVSHGPTGSGPSLMMNALARALDEADLARGVVVVDRPERDGAEAIALLADHSGDGLLAASCTPTYLTTPLKQHLGVTHRDLTPLGQLVADTYLIAVRIDNPATSGSELFRSRTKCAVGSRGGNTHIQAMLVAAATGQPVDLLFYGTSDEAIRALVTGDADWTSGVATDFVSNIDAGRLKIVASLARENEFSPGVVRLIDDGIALSFPLWRGLIGPGQMAPEAIRQWEVWLNAIRPTAAWRAYLKRAGVRDAPSSSAEFRALLESESKRYATWLIDVTAAGG